MKYKCFSRYFRLWVTLYVGLGILCLLHRLAWSTLRQHCLTEDTLFPNALKSTRPKSMNFLELLCTWCNPGLSREALQVELEVSGRGEHGLGGASIPQVGWLCVVFVCMHVCVCSTCCVCGGQRTTVATSWKLCEFRILNSGCQALEPAPWLTDPFCWPHSSL